MEYEKNTGRYSKYTNPNKFFSANYKEVIADEKSWIQKGISDSEKKLNKMNQNKKRMDAGAALSLSAFKYKCKFGFAQDHWDRLGDTKANNSNNLKRSNQMRRR